MFLSNFPNRFCFRVFHNYSIILLDQLEISKRMKGGGRKKFWKIFIYNVTRPDRYPLPNIRDFTNNLRGCKFFSKLDLVKGYNQVPWVRQIFVKLLLWLHLDCLNFYICCLDLRIQSNVCDLDINTLFWTL